MSISNALALAGLINLTLFFLGLAALSRAFSRGRDSHVLQMLLTLYVLFLAGTGWGYSNEYLYSLLYTIASYPSVLAWGLSFFALACVFRYVQSPDWRRLMLAAVLAGVVLIIHALTAVMFTLPFCGLILLLYRRPFPKACRAVVLFGLAAVLLSLVWPFNNVVWQLGRYATPASGVAGAISPKHRWFLSTKALTLAYGPTLSVLPLLFLLKGRTRLLLLVPTCAYAVAWIGGGYAGIGLSHRFQFFLVFCLQFGAALFFWHHWRQYLYAASRHRRARATGFVLLSGLVLVPFPWHPIQSVYEVCSFIRSRVNITGLSINKPLFVMLEEIAGELQGAIPPNARVVADKKHRLAIDMVGIPVLTDGEGYTFDRYAATKSHVEEIVAETHATHFILVERLKPEDVRQLVREWGETVWSSGKRDRWLPQVFLIRILSNNAQRPGTTSSPD
jgi:hypothetical protein